MDLEEAGEKWRAGDAAKSLRFFTRAIDKYGAGLQRFPADFDLAYNKYVIEVFFKDTNWYLPRFADVILLSKRRLRLDFHSSC